MNDRKNTARSTDDKYLEVFFDELFRESDKAFCLMIEHRKVWIPKSQSKDIDVHKHTIMVKEWLVKEKEIENYVNE